MKIPYYMIRDKVSGKYLPRPYFKSRRGQSHMELTQWDDMNRSVVALFNTKASAQGTLTMWLKGQWSSDRDGALSVKEVPTRIKENMEIVKIYLEIP